MNKKDKIIYSILKEIKDNENRKLNDEKIVEPSAKHYGISKENFSKIISYIKEEEFINISFSTSRGIPDVIWFEDAEVTDKGKEYLKQNSALSKTYKGIKEACSWVSMIV